MKKTIQINDLIFDKIKHRYDFYDLNRRRRNGTYLLDSFYPVEVAKAIMNEQDVKANKRSGYAISERVASETGVAKLHISELTTMLGYTKTSIGKILQAAKNKNIGLTLVGLGGTGSNFMYWMHEMAQWVGKENIFSAIHGFDDDIYDVPNLLRIPFMPEMHGEEPLKTNCIPNRFKNISHQQDLKSRKMKDSDLFSRELGPVSMSIVYGAPDIATRTWLTEGQFTFFAATHRDGEYSIVENPAVDNDLMMETYGKINLSKFFLNHLSMTIDFLKYIGQTERNYGQQGGEYSNVEIVREDFNEHFREQLENGFKAGSKKLIVATNDREIVNLELERI